MPDQDPLSADHEEIGKILDHTFTALERGDRQQGLDKLDYFWARLAVHIRAEHLHFFPAILKASVRATPADARSAEDMIEQLRADHNFFMGALAEAVNMMRKMQDDDNGDSLLRLIEVKQRLENVGRHLMIHNDIEEAHIYPLAEVLFSPDEAAEIRRKMKGELDNLPPRFIDGRGDRSMMQPANQKLCLDGFVLVGGASSRMGQNKAQMILGGKRLFERAADVLNVICNGRISLVGGQTGHLAAATDIATLPDLQVADKDLPQAPIVGLYTALAKATTPWIAVLACDLPFVTADLMTKLAGFCSDESDVVVPMQPDARPQPLCAFYCRERCLPVVEEMLRNGDLKLQRFLSRVSTRYVEFDEIADLEGSANFFLNVNKPDDYEFALTIS